MYCEISRKKKKKNILSVRCQCVGICVCVCVRAWCAHMSACVCLYVKDGPGKAQDEMGPARGCSAASKVIDQGHQKIIMRTSLTAR